MSQKSSSNQPAPAPLPSSNDNTDAPLIPLPDLSKVKKKEESQLNFGPNDNNGRSGIGRLEPEECVINNDPNNLEALKRVKS